MAFTAWAASTAFSVGDVRRATTVQPSGLVFRCTVAGTSGSSEPSPWPVVRDITVQDGTVTWVAVSAVGEELNKLAPSTIIELFELDGTATSVGVSQVYRFHSGVNQDVDGDIVWNGNTYSRYPIEASGFEYEGQGQLPRPRISISNVLSLVTTLAIAHNDLVGATVKRIRTLKKYLDASNFTSGSNATADPYASFPEEVFIIDRKVIENRELATFELAATFDVAGVKLPRRQIVQNICPWTYRGEGCGYTGPPIADIKDNKLTSSTNATIQNLYDLRVALEEATAAKNTAFDAYAAAQAETAVQTEAYNNSYAVAETRFSLTSPTYYVSNRASVGNRFNGASVTLSSTTYQQGALRQQTRNVAYYEIQRLAQGSRSALDAAEADEATKKTTYDNAVTAETTAQTAYNNAITAWQDLSDSPSDSADVCSHRLTGCKCRFGDNAELPYGGFPSAGLIG